MDRTTLNVTASNLPKNLFEDPLWTFLYWLLFFLQTDKSEEKLSSAVSSHPISPPAIGAAHLNTNPHATSDSESARCRRSGINLCAPHMETMSCSLEVFRLCITWNFKGQAACKRHRRLCAADNKDGRESSQS